MSYGIQNQPVLRKKSCAGHSSNQLVRRKDSWKILGQHMNNSVAGRIQCAEKKHLICLQVLFSKDYILKKVFRKDGPPLGAEFDPPGNVLSCHTGMSFSAYRAGKMDVLAESPFFIVFSLLSQLSSIIFNLRHLRHIYLCARMCVYAWLLVFPLLVIMLCMFAGICLLVLFENVQILVQYRQENIFLVAESKGMLWVSNSKQ